MEGSHLARRGLMSTMSGQGPLKLSRTTACQSGQPVMPPPVVTPPHHTASFSLETLCVWGGRGAQEEGRRNRSGSLGGWWHLEHLWGLNVGGFWRSPWLLGTGGLVCICGQLYYFGWSLTPMSIHQN